MHCVDLGESFPTHIFLQNLASIQPRTSPVKFARSSNAAIAQVTIGVLRAVRTLAFYNISNGAVLKLKIKKRGGVKHRIDAKVLEFGG